MHRRDLLDALAPRRANGSPWSADGRLLAWSRFDRRSSDAPAKVMVANLALDTRFELDLIFPAFYIQWRPDSAAIATLGEGPLGLELTVIDVESSESQILARGGPLFFDWQANGSLLANVGRDESRRFEFHGEPGDRAVSFDAHAPAAFTAPARLPGSDGFIAAVRVGSASQLVIIGAMAPLCAPSLRSTIHSLRGRRRPSRRGVFGAPSTTPVDPTQPGRPIFDTTSIPHRATSSTHAIVFEFRPAHEKVLTSRSMTSAVRAGFGGTSVRSEGAHALDCAGFASRARILPFSENTRRPRLWSPIAPFCYSERRRAGRRCLLQTSI